MKLREQWPKVKRLLVGEKQPLGETTGPSSLEINIHSPSGVTPVGMGGGGESMGAISALQAGGHLSDEATVQLIYRALLEKGLLGEEEVVGMMGASRSKALVNELTIVTSPINGRFSDFRSGFRASNIKRNLRRAKKRRNNNGGFIL